MNMNTWLSTDLYEEAISGLHLAAENTRVAAEYPYPWKWVILGLHSALQAFMVLALENSNGLLALKDDTAAKWMRSYREGKRLPEEKLDWFPALYDKIKSDHMLFLVVSKKYEPDPTHDYSVNKLNEFRNAFIHFLPSRWLLNVTGLPRICRDCLDVIEFLAWESGNMTWYDDRTIERTRRAVADLANALEARDLQYASDA